jgi:hypothetical protein
MPISDDHPSGTRLLTRQEAAERLSMCIDSIDNLRRAGELASVKIGKSRRILESSSSARPTAGRCPGRSADAPRRTICASAPRKPPPKPTTFENHRPPLGAAVRLIISHRGVEPKGMR